MSSEPHFETPTLTDGRVLLRFVELSEAPLVVDAVKVSAEELQLYMPWFHDGYGPSDAEGFITRAQDAAVRLGEFNFGVFAADSGEFLGGCGVNRRDRDNRSAYIGYWIRSDRTRLGYATAAARLVIDFAFEHIELERITIQAEVDNLASQAVMQKLGAQFEGVARAALRHHDRQRDLTRYAIVRSDWRAAQ